MNLSNHGPKVQRASPTPSESAITGVKGKDRKASGAKAPALQGEVEGRGGRSCRSSRPEPGQAPLRPLESRERWRVLIG
jgi:hypothetical protein